MGIISRLFGDPPPKSTSLIVQWIEPRMYFAQRGKVTPEKFFLGFVNCLSTYAKTTPNGISPTEHDCNVHYGNDSALFEFGCYLYFRTDLWFRQERPSLHERIVLKEICPSFCALFTQVAGIPNVVDLLKHRVINYHRLATEGADAEVYIIHLSQLILRTRDNRKPKLNAYEFDRGPILIVDIIEDTSLKIKLRSWDTVMVPCLTTMMKDLANLLK
jgi:hypothetical protein